MASTVTLVNASAESNPDGGKIDAQISQRDIDALSKSSILYIATVRKDGKPEHASTSLVHRHAGPFSAYSDAARDVEGKAHSPRQSRDRLDRQEARTGVYWQGGNYQRSGSPAPNCRRLSEEVLDDAVRDT
jgi:hypothetical protein